MKRILLTLMLLVTLGVGAAWADTVTQTVTFSGLFEADQELPGEDIYTPDKQVQIEFAKGNTKSSNPKYFKSGTEVRFYWGNSITFKALDKNTEITKVKFVVSTSNGSFIGTPTCSEGSFTDPVWTGNSSEFTIYNGGSSGNTRFKSIEITYTSGGNDDLPTPVLTWSDETGEFTANLGDPFSAPVATATIDNEPKTLPIEYSSSKEAVATVNAETGAVTLRTAGTTTITASLAAADEYNAAKSISYELTVVDPNVEPAKPYVLATSLDDLYDGANVIIVGKGTSNAMSTTQNTNNRGIANVTITDNSILEPGENVSIVKVGITADGYTLYATNGDSTGYLYKAGADSKNYMQVQDTPAYWQITVDKTGVATIVMSNTYYLNYNNSNKIFSCYKNKQTDVQLYVQEDPTEAAKTPVTLKWMQGETEASATTLTTDELDSFASPTLTADPAEALAAVVYSSDNEEVAKFADGKVFLTGTVGTATITAEIKGNETYKDVEVTYTVTVKTGQQKAGSVAEALAFENDTEIIMNFPLTVGYANGVNIWAADAAGDWVYIYKSGAKYSYKNGDVIAAGWEATKTSYKGLDEMVPTTEIGEVTTGGEALTFKEVDAINTDMMNSIVVLQNVKVAAKPTGNEFNVTAGEATYKFYHKFTSISLPEAGTYNVTGVVNSNNALQFVPLSYELLAAEKPEPAYTFAQKEVTVYVEDEQMDIPALLNLPEDIEVMYESSDENVAIVDEGIILFGDPGTTVITAYNEETDKYKAHATTFTLILEAEKPEPPVDVTFDFTKDGAYGMTVQTDSNSYEKEVKSFREDGVTISMAGNYRLYTNSGKVEFRVHKNATLTITADNEYLIKAVSFTSNGTQSKHKDFTNSTYENGVSSLSFTGTDTNQLNTITVTLAKRKVPELETTFSHNIYEEDGVKYNAFELDLILDDNGIGADHYTLALDGKLIDNNVELEDGLAMLEVEYVPYQAVYSLTFTAIDAEGNAMSTYTYPVSHALDIENAVPFDLEQTFYVEPDADAEDGEYAAHLRVTFEIDDCDKGYEYYFAADNGNPNIAFETYVENGETYRNMLVWGISTATKIGNSFIIDTTNLPVLDPQVYTVFPMAHKELVVIDETRAAAPRKVASQEEVVKSTQRSAAAAPITVTATDDNVQTGVEGVSAEGTAEAEYYNLQGVRISEPAAGIYIRRQGSRTSKVVIR